MLVKQDGWGAYKGSLLLVDRNYRVAASRIHHVGCETLA